MRLAEDRRAKRRGLSFSAMMLAISAAPSARAQDAVRSSNDPPPIVAIDTGIGYAQPSMGSTQFTVLDTWNGQHTYYHVNGAALGLMHPSGLLYNATLHVFPFSFRGIGLVSTVEGAMLGADGNATPTAFGSPSSSDSPTLFSIIAGPEGQLRFGPMLVRAGVLGGMRYTSYGDFSATEWRIALRSQVDYVMFGGAKHDSTLTVGLFGSADVYPSLGWSVGTSLTFAIF